MTIRETLIAQCTAAKAASHSLGQTTSFIRNSALTAIADALDRKSTRLNSSH